VNLSDSHAQALVHVGWDDLAGHNWILADKLSGVIYERSGDEMGKTGLYVDSGPWSHNFFEFSRMKIV